MTIQISTFKILSTGNDGGHRYIETEIIYNGKSRRLTAFFKDKSDEARIKPDLTLTIQGKLQDDGDAYGLLLLDAEITG